MPSVLLAVKAGNPRRIQGFEDLLRPGIRIVVTECSGVANPSGTGTWEDVAGRLGRLDDVSAFAARSWPVQRVPLRASRHSKELHADAWITWPEWAVDYPDDLQAIAISPERRIWRDLNLAVSSSADPQAASFIRFLVSPEAQQLMPAAGSVR